MLESPDKVPSYCIPKGEFHPLPGTKPKLHAPRLAGYFDFDPYPLRPGCLVRIRSWFSADGEEEDSWRVLECDGKRLLLLKADRQDPLSDAQFTRERCPARCRSDFKSGTLKEWPLQSHGAANLRNFRRRLVAARRR